MKNQKRTFLNKFIMVAVTFIVAGSFLLLDLGKLFMEVDKVFASETEVSYSEFLHKATLRKSGSLDVAPSITVLTHGYEGHANAWYNGNLEVAGKTLTEKLRTELTADVYIMGIVKDSQVYKKHGYGYVDEKYDAGNDRFVEEGKGRLVSEVGLANCDKK